MVKREKRREHAHTNSIKADVVCTEDDILRSIFVFFKNEKNQPIDVKFVVLLRYGGSEILCFPEIEKKHTHQPVYYITVDECVLKRIERGAYLLTVPKKRAECRAEKDEAPSNVRLIIEHKGRILELEKEMPC